MINKKVKIILTTFYCRNC